MVDVTLQMLPMPALVIDLKSQLILSANDLAGDVLRISPQRLAGSRVDEVIVDWSIYMNRANRASVSGSRQFASRSRRADNFCFQGTWRTGPASSFAHHVVAMLVHYPAVSRYGPKRAIGSDVLPSHEGAARLPMPLRNRVDYLTGLSDRWVLESLVEAALSARCGRGSEDFGLLFVDLDNFKDINDRFGHAHGDRVLAIIAERLVAHVRPTDHVTRYGGDEFVIYAEPISSEVDLRGISSRIMDAVAEPIVVSGSELRLSASVGIALGSKFPTLPGLVEAADRGMYAAKRNIAQRSSAVDA